MQFEEVRDAKKYVLVIHANTLHERQKKMFVLARKKGELIFFTKPDWGPAKTQFQTLFSESPKAAGILTL